jgi:hypothetical protein
MTMFLNFSAACWDLAVFAALGAYPFPAHTRSTSQDDLSMGYD